MTLKQESYWQKSKNDFIFALKLTTHKVALISTLLALTTLVSLMEIPTFFMPFLTVDFGNTINLLAVLIIRLPYALLIAIIVPWLRLVLPHIGSGGNVIGEFAYMLSSITILLLYFGFRQLINQLPWWKNQPRKWGKRMMMVEVPTMIISCLLQSLINTFFNWSFILDWYGASALKNDLWVIFFPYNLFKFTLVLGLFLILTRPVRILAHHVNF